MGQQAVSARIGQMPLFNHAEARYSIPPYDQKVRNVWQIGIVKNNLLCWSWYMQLTIPPTSNTLLFLSPRETIKKFHPGLCHQAQTPELLRIVGWLPPLHTPLFSCSPNNIPALISGTCEQVMLHHKRDFQV